MYTKGGWEGKGVMAKRKELFVYFSHHVTPIPYEFRPGTLWRLRKNIFSLCNLFLSQLELQQITKFKSYFKTNLFRAAYDYCLQG